jgi:hypothetical protein
MGLEKQEDKNDAAIEGIYTILALAAKTFDGTEAMKLSQAAVNSSMALLNIADFKKR